MSACATASKLAVRPQNCDQKPEQHHTDDERGANGRRRHAHITNRAYDDAILSALQCVAVTRCSSAGSYVHVEDCLVCLRAPKPTVDPLLDHVEPEHPRQNSRRQGQAEREAEDSATESPRGARGFD